MKEIRREGHEVRRQAGYEADPRERTFPYSGADLSGTKQVVEFARSLQDSDVEKFLVLYLNARNKLNCISVQMGTVNQAVVYPREIVKHCILSNACAVILVHNHPSGHVRPSERTSV